ncbi:MAG: hypothetical protein E7233_10750 [Lachnospiraceae bacterium]|nr:hypothetical protein [Lachnospiraceae bacterium]
MVNSNNEIIIAKPKSLGTVALDLLMEIDEICRKNEIEYFLSPGLVKRAVEEVDFDEYYTTASVYMTLEDTLRFIQAFEENRPEGRSLDYLGNNNSYASFNVSYVNTETTFIDITRGWDFNEFGIKVVINIIRNDIINKIPAFIETGRESNSNKVKKKGNWKKRTFAALVANRMDAKGDEFGSSLFEYYVKNYRKNPNSKKVFVRRFRKKRMYFERSIFSDTCLVSLGGYQFQAPKDINGYLEIAYGEDHEEIELKPYRQKNRIISTTVPYKDYFDSLEKKHIPIEDVFSQDREVKTDKIINKKLLRAVSKVYRIARMSEERMIIYQQLMENVDEIREIYDNEDFETLQEIFDEYDARARYYLKHKLALCPSEEFFEMECALMEYNGDVKKAEKMRDLLAYHHRKPLVGKAEI